MCSLFLYGPSICGSGLLEKGIEGRNLELYAPLGVDPRLPAVQKKKKEFGIRKVSSGKYRHCRVLVLVFRSGPFPWRQSAQMLLAATAPYSLTTIASGFLIASFQSWH